MNGHYWSQAFPISTHQLRDSKYQFGIFSVNKIINSERDFINSGRDFINSVSIRRNGYLSGNRLYLSGNIFYLFGKIFRNTGLIDVFPGSQNDFSGLISPRLSRLCRYLPRVLIVTLSFRVSIRGFCRDFVDIYREFSETAGKIPKRYSDRRILFG